MPEEDIKDYELYNGSVSNATWAEAARQSQERADAARAKQYRQWRWRMITGMLKLAFTLAALWVGLYFVVKLIV